MCSEHCWVPSHEGPDFSPWASPVSDAVCPQHCDSDPSVLSWRQDHTLVLPALSPAAGPSCVCRRELRWGVSGRHRSGGFGVCLLAESDRGTVCRAQGQSPDPVLAGWEVEACPAAGHGGYRPQSRGSLPTVQARRL